MLTLSLICATFQYWSFLTTLEVLTAATENLFLNRPFDPKDEDHVFATLTVRIGLEIGEGEASARLAREAVRSHMRILTSVIGSHIITTSAPEPMLAIAAAQAINASPKTYQHAIGMLIDKLILRGLVLDRGMQGELYSRLLLTLARDKAVVQGGSFLRVDPRSIVPHVRAVSLSHFLQNLLGKGLGTSDRQETLRQNLLQDMSGIWINFTHIAQLSKPIDEVTPSFLLRAWSSCTAFQCAFLQEVMDGFIVGYAGELDEPFNIRKLVIIPWQTKARSKAANLALAHQLTSPPIVEKDNGNLLQRKPGHLVILMDLAASSAFSHANGPCVDLSYAPAVRPTGRGGKWDGYARDNEVEPSRYCLNIRGHGSGTYPILQEFDSPFGHLFCRSLGFPQPDFEEYHEAMERDLGWVEQGE
jgi:hypothetical protein